jgi:nuclear pore complex protein Nup98-Nup96
MARFTALPSDTSEDDEKYVASPPRKSPQPRPRGTLPPARVQQADEDAEMISDSGSSRADEEEEEEEEEEPHSDSSRSSADNRPRASARASGSAYVPEEPGEEEDSGESSRSSLEVVVLPEHRRGDPSVIPWAQRLGIDPQKMHVMHASLFPGPESAETHTLKPSNAGKQDRARLTPNGLHRKHSRDSEGEGLRAATQEVCVQLFLLYSQVRGIGPFAHFLYAASEPPSLMISNPSLSVPLASMLEWRALPLL